MKNEKEYLYVGHYIDHKERYILKVGTTNNLERRKQEHERKYKATREYTMPEGGSFIYDWVLKLSKYDTLRYEDRTKTAWKEAKIGNYIRNDRFYCTAKPEKVYITIRKTYEITL